MGVTATTRLPAGWYPDPDGDNLRRWWDGHAWTEYTAQFQRPTSVDELDLGQAPTSADKKVAKSARPARRLRRVETAAIDTVEAPEADAPASKARTRAERLGRLLAGVVHKAPSLKRSGKARRAHRFQR